MIPFMRRKDQETSKIISFLLYYHSRQTWELEGSVRGLRSEHLDLLKLIVSYLQFTLIIQIKAFKQHPRPGRILKRRNTCGIIWTPNRQIMEDITARQKVFGTLIILDTFPRLKPTMGEDIVPSFRVILYPFMPNIYLQIKIYIIC